MITERIAIYVRNYHRVSFLNIINSNLVVPKIIGSPMTVSHTSHQFYWASLITQEKGQSHDHRT